MGLVPQGPGALWAWYPEGLVYHGPGVPWAWCPEGLVYRGPGARGPSVVVGLVPRGPGAAAWWQWVEEGGDTCVQYPPQKVTRYDAVLVLQGRMWAVGQVGGGTPMPFVWSPVT